MFLEFTNGNLGSALCSSLLGKGELFAFLALLNGNQCSEFHSVLLKIIVVKAKTDLRENIFYQCYGQLVCVEFVENIFLIVLHVTDLTILRDCLFCYHQVMN